MVDKIFIEVEASDVSVTPCGRYGITVAMEGVSTGDILNHFSKEDVIQHFTVEDILEEIGIDKVKEYFNLIENEED